MMNSFLSLFIDFNAFVLLALSFWVKPGIRGWKFYIILIAGFIVGGIILKSYFIVGSGLLGAIIFGYRFRKYLERNRPLELILIPDRDDHYLNYFLNYYRKDISKYVPRFNFKIEEEYLVALLFSKMETIGLIIAEIRDADTLKICIDYMVPKHRNSQLAKTFYQCELRCIDFLGYRQIFIEPQSKEHNDYLKRIGFKLVDGKYIINH